MILQIEGTYTRSSFGGSVNALVRLSAPIADLSAEQIVDLENGEFDEL